MQIYRIDLIPSGRCLTEMMSSATRRPYPAAGMSYVVSHNRCTLKWNTFVRRRPNPRCVLLPLELVLVSRCTRYVVNCEREGVSPGLIMIDGE